MKIEVKTFWRIYKKGTIGTDDFHLYGTVHDIRDIEPYVRRGMTIYKVTQTVLSEEEEVVSCPSSAS